MTLDKFKEGLKSQGLINDEMLEQFGDEQLEVMLPMIKEYEDNGKVERGLSAMGLMIGLKMAGYDKDQVLDIFKEAGENPKKYTNEEEADWLLKKTKLGIK